MNLTLDGAVSAVVTCKTILSFILSVYTVVKATFKKYSIANHKKQALQCNFVMHFMRLLSVCHELNNQSEYETDDDYLQNSITHYISFPCKKLLLETVNHTSQ